MCDSRENTSLSLVTIFYPREELQFIIYVINSTSAFLAEESLSDCLKKVHSSTDINGEPAAVNLIILAWLKPSLDPACTHNAAAKPFHPVLFPQRCCPTLGWKRPSSPSCVPVWFHRFPNRRSNQAMLSLVMVHNVQGCELKARFYFFPRRTF